MSALLDLRARARFALWVLRARAELRRRGGRLVVHGRARFDGPPRLRAGEGGEGGGTLTLELAEGVRLGRDLHLDVEAGATNRLVLGAGVYFQHAARVQLRGGEIRLGDHTHVRDGVTLKSAGSLRVGEEVTIGAHDTLACVEAVEIGDRCGLGERVTVTDSDHTHDGSDRHYLRQPLRVEPVRLGANVLVSAGAVVARGARIGDNAVVAANAVVTGGEHPGGHLLAGAPARPVRPLS